jgi:GntR family transcriptional regulator, transcriptional repressor for pyruvate dehydrogenase complex
MTSAEPGDGRPPLAARPAGGSSDIFSRVTPGRISQDIVQQVKGAIREGQLKPGDRLPPERELTERFGASRVTVRDALRILEASGLIEIRVGARGGAFVTAPAPDWVGEGIANMLMMASVTAEDVTEARFIFELGLVPLVCERRTAEDIAALEEICDRAEQALRDGDYDVKLSAEFHTRLARSTHNDAIEMIVDSFHGPLLMSLTQAQRVAPQMGRRGTKEHRELIAAIRDRDHERARSIMSKHLARTAERVKAGSRRRGGG